MPAVVLAGGNEDDDSIPPSGRSTGSRGWYENSAIPVKCARTHLTAPSGRLGQTVSTRPTFAWFVDASSWPIEFRLYEHDLSNDTFKLVKEIKDEGFKSSPGIMVLFFQSQSRAVGQAISLAGRTSLQPKPSF